jgi:hypothetical protein
MNILDKITAKLDLLYLKEEDFKLKFRKKIGGAAFDKFYKEHLLKWKISDYKQLNKKKQEEFWTEFRDDWDKHPDAIDLDEAEAKSGDQEAYQKFFQAKLKKYGVKSPSELDDDKKKKFFDEVEKGWKAKDESTIYEAKEKLYPMWSMYQNHIVDWKDFYKGAKDTGGYNKDFEKKYGKILMFPHIEDALKRTKTYDQFIKFIKQFENVDEAEQKSGDQEAYQKFFQAKLKKYKVKSPSELSDEDKKKFFDEVEKGWKGKDESTKIDEISIPDRHQLKIAIDTVKNPAKGMFLGGPSAKEAEEILRKKFRYTDAQIKKLKESTTLSETKITVYDNGGKTADRYSVIIGKDVYSMSDNATSPNGVNMYAGEIGADVHPSFLKSMKQVKVQTLPQAVQKAIKQRADDSEY